MTNLLNKLFELHTTRIGDDLHDLKADCFANGLIENAITFGLAVAEFEKEFREDEDNTGRNPFSENYNRDTELMVVFSNMEKFWTSNEVASSKYGRDDFFYFVHDAFWDAQNLIDSGDYTQCERCKQVIAKKEAYTAPYYRVHGLCANCMRMILTPPPPQEEAKKPTNVMKFKDFIGLDIDIEVYIDGIDEGLPSFVGPCKLTDTGKKYFNCLLECEVTASEDSFEESDTAWINIDLQEGEVDPCVFDFRENRLKEFLTWFAGYCQESLYKKMFEGEYETDEDDDE